MKSFLLCISLTLFLALQAHAQDTTHTADQTQPGSAGNTVSMPAIPDSTSKDSLRQKTRPDSLKTAPPAHPGQYKDTTTGIVDIFEEMQKAQLQQDNTIKKETQQRATDKTSRAAASKTAAPRPDSSLKNGAPEAADGTDSGAISQFDTLRRDTIQSIFTLPLQPAASAAYPGDSMPAAAAPAQLNQLFQAKTDTATADTHQAKNPASSHNNTAGPETAMDNKSAEPRSGRSAQSNEQAGPVFRKTDSVPALSSSIPGSTDTTTDSSRLLSAQSTPFTELFQPYKTFDKETNIASTTSLTILQQNVDYKTSADFTTQYQRTGQRDGQFLFDVSVVKLNTQVETMGVQLKYDSNQRTDSTSTFAKPLFDIVGKRTYLEVDSSGKITSVDSTALGRQVNSVLNGLSLSGGNFEAGSNFGLLLSQSGKIAQGQTWTDTVSHKGNQSSTTYTVQNIMDGELLVTISGTVSQTGEINSDGAVFKTHFNGTQKGKMYVDQQTLLVRSREITLTMKGTVDYNGQSLPASATSKIKEKVTAN